MKKVLIISNIWPYTPGNLRVPGLAKNLPNFGWEPVVLTMPLPTDTKLEYRVIEVSYHDWLKICIRRLGFNPDKSIKKQVSSKLGISSNKSTLDLLFYKLNEILSFPDSGQGWEKPAIRKAYQTLEQEHFDAIISISPPVLTHLVAHKAKNKYGIPWIADFPHLWSQNNGYPYSELRRWFDRRLELRTMRNADVLVSVAEPLTDKIKFLHKMNNVYTIAHGFDMETLNIPPAPLSNKFTITYTGSWHSTLREPSMLFKALQSLINKGEIGPQKIEVRFFGEKELWLDTEIKRYGLSEIVHEYGPISLDESRSKQRESQLLFQPKWNDPKEQGMMSSKIFEYLAACRPILATGQYRDVVDNVIEQTMSGVCASSEEETEKYLKTYYQEFKLSGKINYQGDINQILKYSHRNMAQQFASLLSNTQLSSTSSSGY